MNKVKFVGALLSIFISVPIWFYLLYNILVSIDAGRLEWFLFWVYVPISIFSAMILKVLGDE